MRQAAAGDALVDLYLPQCLPLDAPARVLAHLGQSIDGFVATASGDSDFVNDRENILHLHRLRALHDAVIVGAGTVAADDPELTTRLVPGPSPVRIVLDPRRRLPESARLFSDGRSRTLLVAAESTGGAASHGQAEVVCVRMRDGRLDAAQLIAQLTERGLRRLFVEGGGTTVSLCYAAGLLDRLQIAVAPVFTGKGRPGLRLPAQERMADCPRPPHRLFTMGRDILFDCDLGAGSGTTPAPDDARSMTPAEAPSIRRLA